MISSSTNYQERGTVSLTKTKQASAILKESFVENRNIFF